ncbi:MAG TPA: hypothetical protein P5076_22170 [Myxococcota bacterium]|nr:hypothetical protein [Myxococcota bacterium]
MLELWDAARARPVTTALWYPAPRPGAGAVRANYLAILEGRAYEGVPAAVADGPFPLVMFSHGNQGVAVQSPSLCEHLASQGFVVAAPTHAGNTIVDSPSAEEMAAAALARPLDVAFALAETLAIGAEPGSDLHGLVDPDRLGVMGHSFGGYTTLVLAGGRVDVDAAQARCAAGVPNDVFCPAIAHLPAGSTLARPDGLPRFAAALALAPGSWGAFGDDGLAGVDAPTLVMGGTHDEFTLQDTLPIYAGLPPPKALVDLEGAGHMAFTDLCRMELPVPELQAMCDPATHLDMARGFELIHAFAARFLRSQLGGEPALADGLAESPDWPEAHVEREGI